MMDHAPEMLSTVKEHAAEMPQGRGGALSPKSPHHRGVAEENCRVCGKKKSKGKGQGYQREGRQEALVRRVTTGGEWKELDHVQPAAAQEQDDSCLCVPTAVVWGLNLFY